MSGGRNGGARSLPESWLSQRRDRTDAARAGGAEACWEGWPWLPGRPGLAPKPWAVSPHPWVLAPPHLGH